MAGVAVLRYARNDRLDAIAPDILTSIAENRYGSISHLANSLLPRWPIAGPFSYVTFVMVPEVTSGTYAPHPFRIQ